jgi:integrase
VRISVGADDQTRRSVASNLRQARSVLRRALWEDYKQAGIRMPESVSSFIDQFVTRVPKKRYEMPPATLYTPTIEAGRKLTGTRGIIWTLAYDLGMRAGEIAAARWDWFEVDQTAAGPRVWMAIRRRADWAPKGTEGRVPVFPGVWARLEALRGAGSDYLVPGDTENAREDLVKRDFAEWMRGLGWETRMCAHELRKLRGSWWFARYGIERAYEWLRHANMQTTLDSYAKLPRQVEPEWIEAPNVDEQKRLAAEIQKQAFIDVPYVPLGQLRGQTVHRKNITGIQFGWPMIWGVKRA